MSDRRRVATCGCDGRVVCQRANTVVQEKYLVAAEVAGKPRIVIFFTVEHHQDLRLAFRFPLPWHLQGGDSTGYSHRGSMILKTRWQDDEAGR